MVPRKTLLVKTNLIIFRMFKIVASVVDILGCLKENSSIISWVYLFNLSKLNVSQDAPSSVSQVCDTVQ